MSGRWLGRGGGDVTPRIIRRGAAGGGRRQTVWSAGEIHQISPGRRRFLTDVTIAVLAWPVVSSVVVFLRDGRDFC